MKRFISSFTSSSSSALLLACSLLSHVLVAQDSVPSPLPAATVALTNLTCYNTAGSLTDQGTAQYQSSGHCHDLCTYLNHTVFAMTMGNECYCGDAVPPDSDKVDYASYCNKGCAGYDQEPCGGLKAWSFFLTGVNGVTLQDLQAASNTSSTSSSTTSTASASVVTVNGQTATVTASGPTDAASSNSSLGPNKTGLAIGITVGIVSLGLICGVALIFMRNRKRRAIEEEYRRNSAINKFIGQKPGSAAGTSSDSSDSRLDPLAMQQRRMSDGSIMDNQDYSRRILKVTNA